ncbi:hypothetical protein BH23ACT6_BH23ACT6_05950 [soil metagenome]
MTSFLAFVALGVVLLFALGRAVTPRPKKKRIWAMNLDDYGATLIRGVGLFAAAGARNRWKMNNIQKQAGYSERGHNDGDRLPTDATEQPPEQIPPGAFPPGQFPTDRFPTGHFPTEFIPPSSSTTPPPDAAPPADHSDDDDIPPPTR